MELVTVIITVFNKEKDLSSSIKSVLNQSYQNLEIVIINDGSTDRSEEIILNFQVKDSRIKYIKQKNQGVSAARNTGIELAQGKYLSFLDADDYFDPFFIEKMVGKIGKCTACYCGHYFVYPDNRKKKSWQNFLKGDVLEEYLLNKCSPHTNSWLISRDFLMLNNLFFEVVLDWGEDMLFFAKLMALNTELQCVEEYLTFYRLGVSDSLSTTDINKINKDILWLNMYMKFLNETDIDISRKQRVLESINNYRLPALVVYQLWSNRNLLNNDDFSLVHNEMERYIHNIKLNNGLRSIKLYIYSLFLKFHIIKLKGRLM